MNWHDLIKIPCWTPIEETGIKITKLADTLYQVSHNCYFIAVDIDRNCEPTPSNNVTLLLWAENEGAALRAAAMEIESDKIDDHQIIPPEMLLPGAPQTYGEMIKALKTGKHGTFLESYAYRIAKDGAFIHRDLQVSPFHFFFRTLTEDHSERPYAIWLRLPDAKRSPTKISVLNKKGFRYTQELVLQFPASSINDYDTLIELEDRFIAGLGEIGKVDGHDMGVGQMNIFVHTNHPKLAFEKIKSLLGTQDFLPELKAAYRDVGKDNYIILHPPGLSHFSIA